MLVFLLCPCLFQTVTSTKAEAMSASSLTLFYPGPGQVPGTDKKLTKQTLNKESFCTHIHKKQNSEWDLDVAGHGIHKQLCKSSKLMPRRAQQKCSEAHLIHQPTQPSIHNSPRHLNLLLVCMLYLRLSNHISP